MQAVLRSDGCSLARVQAFRYRLVCTLLSLQHSTKPDCVFVLPLLHPPGVESSVLAPFKLDTSALAQPGCSMQLVLLPYGEDKQSTGYSK